MAALAAEEAGTELAESRMVSLAELVAGAC